MEARILEQRVSGIPLVLGLPAGEARCPGVVVVHDALGMTEDLRAQVRWLGAAGFVRNSRKSTVAWSSEATRARA